MAGGIGSRFWPQSRVSEPKQFLDVLNTGRTLIQSTFERFLTIVPPENIYVVTTTDYYGLIIEQLEHLNPENLILEPERKNTAPCIGYACYKIGKNNPNANILIAPSDHIIIGEKKFEAIVKNSFKFVGRNSALVTIGIKPNKPSTGYGYIQFVEDDTNLFKRVKTFTEKPDEELASTFLKSGDFLWNAGIFVWNIQSFIRNFEENLPEMGELLKSVWQDLNTIKETTAMNNVYSQFSNISIDYGLMEKARDVYVIPADFEWSDLGSWSSIYEDLEKDYLGNATTSKLVKVYNASNNLIVAPKGKLVILQGLEGKCIVDTKDALMILDLDREQDVKNFTTDLKRDKLDKFL